MFIFAYLLASLIIGFSISRKLINHESPEENITLGLLVGLTINTFLNYCSYRLFGFVYLNSILIELFLSFAGIILLLNTKGPRFNFNIKQSSVLIILLLLSLLIFYPLFKSHMLENRNGNLYTGGASYGDLAFHVTLINFFLYGQYQQLQNPVFAGTPLVYAPLMDFLSSLLVFTGSTIQQSLIVPGIVYSLLISALIYFFSMEIFKKSSIALLTLFLFIFNGGLGFTYFFSDLQKSGQGISYIWSMTKQYSHLAEYNIRFSNIISDYFLPQRTFLMGFPIGLLIIILVVRYFKSHNKNLLIVAAFLAGLLPVIHPHSLIAISIFLLFSTIINFKLKVLKQLFFYFAVPFFIFSVIPLLSILNSSQVTESFGRVQLFWMSKDQNPFLFYFNNLGFVIPLTIISLFIITKSKLKIYIPFLAIFIITNVYIFQPHDYDNMKIMIYWFVASLPFVSYLIYELWRKNAVTKLLVITLIIPILSLSGLLSLVRESYAIFQIYDGDGLTVADFVRRNTKPSDIFLTSDQHNHPITSFSGRPIVMGYRGWLWTWGYNYQTRERDITDIYKGTLKTPYLLSKYNIAYVIIGPSEKVNFNANTEYFEANYPKLPVLGAYNIYDVSNRKN